MAESAWGLKPCPFCGGKKIGYDYAKKTLDDQPIEQYKLVCNANDGGCGASSGWYESIMNAVDAWNRRANDGTA